MKNNVELVWELMCALNVSMDEVEDLVLSLGVEEEAVNTSLPKFDPMFKTPTPTPTKKTLVPSDDDEMGNYGDTSGFFERHKDPSIVDSEAGTQADDDMDDDFGGK